MKTMLERLGDVVAPMIGNSPWTTHEAVIEILTALREPAEGMVEAGQETGQNNIIIWEHDASFTNEASRRVWRAMIDHILAEPDSPRG